MFSRGTWLSCFLLTAACGGGPEMPSDAAGLDAPGSDGGGSCVAQPDGASCGPTSVCSQGSCVPSSCGDDVLDMRTEQCDDGNTTAFDGCEPDCSFTCTTDATCDDGQPCNGVETCTRTHLCMAGGSLAEGTTCTTAAIADGRCHMQRCILTTCGNSVVDPGEQCDDGNDVAGDGCEFDCHTTCVDPPPEACNMMDDDCDGMIDEDVAASCYPDNDGDRFAAAGAVPVRMCGMCPSGFTDRAPIGDSNTDCSDTDSSINPGVTETCSVPAVDQNCNGNADEGYVVCYADTDMDGYAPAGTAALAPACPAGTGFGGCAVGYTSRDPSVSGNADCAGTVMTRYPGATETCNGADDNCDGVVDDGFIEPRTLYYDGDGDTYGAGPARVMMLPSCAPNPSGYTTNASDCCDTDMGSHPSGFLMMLSYHTALNACGSWDWDCNGTADPEPSMTCTMTGTFCVANNSTITYSGTPACGTSVTYMRNCTCGAACMPGGCNSTVTTNVPCR